MSSPESGDPVATSQDSEAADNVPGKADAGQTKAPSLTEAADEKSTPEAKPGSQNDGHAGAEGGSQPGADSAAAKTAAREAVSPSPGSDAKGTAAGQSEKSAQDKTPAQAKAVTASAIPTIRRAGYFENIVTAFRHINEAVSTEGKRLRASDYISVVLLPLAGLALLYGSWNEQAKETRPYMLLVFNFVALYFIGARIGILRSLTRRQTHLVWSMMCACFLLGCTFSFLVYDFVRCLNLPSGQ